MKKTMSLMATLALLVTAGVTQAAEESGWQYKVTPYFWAMGIDGDIGIGPATASIDYPFTDAIQDLQAGGMLAFEADKDQWNLLLDGSYVNVDDKKNTAIGAFRAELEQWVVQGAAAYTVMQDETLRLDLGLGARYLGTDVDVNFPGDRTNAKTSEGWVDPIALLRLRAQFAENCFGVLVGDIGGFGVESDLTAQITAAAGYAFTDTTSMLLGYRYLYYDYEKDNFSYDVDTSGLVLGVQFKL